MYVYKYIYIEREMWGQSKRALDSTVYACIYVCLDTFRLYSLRISMQVYCLRSAFIAALYRA